MPHHHHHRHHHHHQQQLPPDVFYEQQDFYGQPYGQPAAQVIYEQPFYEQRPTQILYGQPQQPFYQQPSHRSFYQQPSHRSFFHSIQIDKGTAWGRTHRTLWELGRGHASSLPPAVDLRYNFNDAGIEVYDQGSLNSCTANAICAAWQYAQAKVDPGFRPSRLFVYYNERSAEGTTSADSGALISDGCRSLVSYGVCSEYSWPYDERAESTQPPHQAYTEARSHTIHTPAQINYDSLECLKDSLAQDRPFVVGIALFSDFMGDSVRSTGVVPMPGSYSQLQGYHAVLCVGYDDRRRVWIFRNSWGPDWGDQGHFYLPYEYLTVDDHLASDFWNIATDWQEY